MLDPVRAERVRKMVLDPSTWPLPFLPMKQIRSGGIVLFGRIFPPVAPDRICILYEDDARSHLFSSLDEVIEADWAVD